MRSETSVETSIEPQEPQATGTRTPWLIPLVLAGLGALGWACQEPGAGADDGNAGAGGEHPTLRRSVLASIANNVLIPRTAAFAEASATLQAATQAHADAPSADTLLAAQTAWSDAMLQWQQLEVMQVGPAAPAAVGIGGEDRRDAVYSWPTVDTCSVDRALVAEDYAAADFFATQLVWAYGLDALEYLLFVHDESHTCATAAQLDAPWAALGTDEIEQRRAAYAVTLASGVHDQATALAERWSPSGGDFAAALAEPGADGSPYDNDGEALNDVFRALFYVPSQTKDAKLGIPLGVVGACAAVPCVNLIEAPWSGEAARAIAANLQGLQLMIQGGPDRQTADGFDDLLEASGEGQIADDLLAKIEVAIAAAETFDMSLQEAIVASPEDVTRLYTAIKAVTDVLKGPMVMTLMLTIPAEGAGDND